MDSIVKPIIHILDDDAFTLKLLARMLEQQGISRIDTSQSAQHVLDNMSDGMLTPDLLLLDLNMPDMDGLAFIRTLAKSKYAGSLALISGADNSVIEAAAKLAKAHSIEVIGALTKPVKPQELKALVHSWHSVVTSRSEKRQATAPSLALDDLRAALQQGELVNYYQPKVEVASGRVVGVEALVRWFHPDKGMIAPGYFIPLAEQHGLIDALTRQVVANALTDIQSWRDNGRPFPVAVNISMESLDSQQLLEDILAQLADAQVTPQELSFEVTESRLLADMRSPLEILTRLRLNHFELALDDFGTGYATFSQLSDFPFTELKIDRRFVHGVASSGTIRNFYHACLSLSREFGLSVVAEGVEERADWDFIQASGNIYAQGFFIARPMPAEQLHAWSLEWQQRVSQEQLIQHA